MAIVRLTGQDATGTSTTTSVSATYASTPTAGNLLVSVVFNNAADGVVSLPGWSLAVYSNSSAANEHYLRYKVATGAESTTVTATGGNNNMIMAIYEYSGLATSSPLDKIAQSAGGPGVTSVSVGPTLTTTVANELLFAAGVPGGAVISSPAWNNSFNLRNSVPNATFTLVTGDQIVSATGAYSTTLSWTTSANNPSISLATFKALTIGGWQMVFK